MTGRLLPDPRAHPLMTAGEVAPFLGLGRSATYVAIANGEIPCVHIGSRIRVPTAALWRYFGLDPDMSGAGPSPDPAAATATHHREGRDDRSTEPNPLRAV